MVDLAAFPGKVGPAVAPPVPLLVGQAAAAVLAGRATQFTLAATNKTKQIKQTDKEGEEGAGVEEDKKEEGLLSPTVYLR